MPPDADGVKIFAGSEIPSETVGRGIAVFGRLSAGDRSLGDRPELEGAPGKIQSMRAHVSQVAIAIFEPAPPGQAAAEIVVLVRKHGARAAPEIPVQARRRRIGIQIERCAGRKSAVAPAMDVVNLPKQSALNNFHAATE